MKLLSAIMALVAFSSTAVAANRSLTTVWTISDAEVSTVPALVRRGDFLIKQRLLPAGLVQLAGGGPQGLGAGKQLVEIQSPGALVFCDPVLQSQKLIGHAQPCLVDADQDGRFEGMFLTTSVTKGILTVQGSRPKTPKPIAPLAYRRIDPTEFDGDLFMGVQYRGNANPVGNHVFEINFGSPEQSGSLTNRFVHKKSEIPGSKNVLGGQFTILGATPEGIRVRVDKGFPRQPFGVLQTTTYRIY